MTSQASLPFEVPIFGPDDGVQAALLGAGRLELNHAWSYALGGTTPTLSELSALLSSLASSSSSTTTTTNRPAIRIMIRPRGPPPSPHDDTITDAGPSLPDQHQDFLYTPAELTTMAASIRDFITSGLLDAEKGDGFVFGVLKRRRGSLDGGVSGSGLLELELDRKANGELVRLAKEGGGFKCVLHRAVDDLLSASGSEFGTAGVGEEVVEGIKGCGFDGVLTSGGRGNAVDNVGTLGAVVAAARRRGVEVVIGGGVRRANLKRLAEGLGLGDGEGVWFHSSCLDSEGRFSPEEAKGLAEGLSAPRML